MAHTNPREDAHETPTEDDLEMSVDAWLEEMSRQINPAECDSLTELGIYSVHDHGTARSITLPEAADGFGGVTTVKQYYFEGEECPLLLVAPVEA